MVAAFAAAIGSIHAQEVEVAEISLDPVVSEVPVYVENAQLIRNGSLMTANMTINGSDLKLKSNQATVFTPMIVNGPDTLKLTPVGFYGRTRWYQYLRGISVPGMSEGQTPVRYKKNMGEVELNQNVNYEPWMNGSTLIVRKDDYGCAACNEGLPVTTDLVAYNEGEIYTPYEPMLLFEEVVAAEVKTRELSGRAYVDFPVNKIVIYPDYRNNTYELGKIIATIDSVKNDPDITVTSINIAGTASPEGPYDNNVYLATNRTKALKEYVQNLYKFPEGFITTNFDPVDWKGLREWLENNNLENKDKILAIVNSDIEPFARNSKIMKDFPVQYEWLLRNVYPALRHSDYLIQYQIRSFTDIDEIARIISTAPQKLSLNEMYRLASSLTPGTPEYNEVFEIAVRMYPQDETANLNAANAALSRKDLVSAQKYLERAGNSPKAIYARGVFKAMQGDFNEGIRLVEEAQKQGLQNVDAMLDSMKKAANYSKK